MVKNYFSRTAPLLVEVVHVELPHEGIEVRVLECVGKRLFFENFTADNFERQAIIGPLDTILVIFARADIEELLKECRNAFSIPCSACWLLELACSV